MTFHWRELLLTIIAYGIGSIPFGYLIVQVKKGLDIRSVGSGNIGATNVLRTVGRSGAFLTLFLDGAKGFLVVWIADSWTGHNPAAIGISALAVLLGHIFPVFLRFRGGKGVATALGIFLYIALIPILWTLGIFTAVVLISRYISLGSIVAAVVFPILYFFIQFKHQNSVWLLISVCFCCFLVIAKHHDNLRRLLSGRENKFSGLTK
jgi:acyl phosphate:glycerol-3-phosphate acyltransferase